MAKVSAGKAKENGGDESPNRPPLPAEGSFTGSPVCVFTEMMPPRKTGRSGEWLILEAQSNAPIVFVRGSRCYSIPAERGTGSYHTSVSSVLGPETAPFCIVKSRWGDRYYTTHPTKVQRSLEMLRAELTVCEKGGEVIAGEPFAACARPHSSRSNRSESAATFILLVTNTIEPRWIPWPSTFGSPLRCWALDDGRGFVQATDDSGEKHLFLFDPRNETAQWQRFAPPGEFYLFNYRRVGNNAFVCEGQRASDLMVTTYVLSAENEWREDPSIDVTGQEVLYRYMRERDGSLKELTVNGERCRYFVAADNTIGDGFRVCVATKFNSSTMSLVSKGIFEYEFSDTSPESRPFTIHGLAAPRPGAFLICSTRVEDDVRPMQGELWVARLSHPLRWMPVNLEELRPTRDNGVVSVQNCGFVNERLVVGYGTRTARGDFFCLSSFDNDLCRSHELWRGPEPFFRISSESREALFYSFEDDNRNWIGAVMPVGDRLQLFDLTSPYASVVNFYSAKSGALYWCENDTTNGPGESRNSRICRLRPGEKRATTIFEAVRESLGMIHGFLIASDELTLTAVCFKPPLKKAVVVRKKGKLSLHAIDVY